MIDFLQRELDEKNLLVRTLLLRDANDGAMIDSSLLKNVSSTNVIENSSDKTASILTEFTQEDNIIFNDYDSHTDNSCISSSSIVCSVIENTQEINKVSKNDLNNLQKIANDYDETCYYDTLHSIDESLSTDDTSTTESSIYCSTLISPNSHTNTIRIDVTNYRCESLDEQIKCYRESNHAAFKSHKFGDINNRNNDITQSNDSKMWPPHTILIASDSMLQNVDETRLCKNKYNVKVRAFRGSVIHDMYDYLTPLLRKKPEYVILHVSTNDCVNLSSKKVMQDLLNLTSISSRYPVLM